MIIGPNGTGKSTIVCAIALGLGWKPAVLGRAKDVASFVKQNKNVGSIELELKTGLDEQENVIIERVISASDNTSVWHLNRRKASAKDVTDKVDALGIDIGNLCCFLPQDRVADFARMDPPELLKETQKAAGQQGMTQWHEQLIEHGAKQTKLRADILSREGEVKNLEERMDYLSRDVRRAEERQGIERQLAALEIMVAEVEYKEIKQQYEEAKASRVSQEKHFANIKTELIPISRHLENIQNSIQEKDQQINSDKLRLEKDQILLRKNDNMLQTLETEAAKLTESLDSVKTREQERKRVISQLQKGVEELEKSVRVEPHQANTAHIDESIRNIRSEIRNLQGDEEEARQEEEEIAIEVKGLDRDTDAARARLQQLDNVANVRLQALQKSDLDTYKAVMWLRENGGFFKEKVFEPVMLSVSIRKQAMVSAVEGCINWAAMKTFVCQTEEDYDLFGRLVAGRQGLRVNFCHRENARPLSSFNRPVSRQVLESYGFEDFVIDLIDGPEPVLQYLCHDLHLESIPVGRDERKIDIRAVEQSGKFQRYITGHSLHTLSRSQYGQRSIQTLTRALKPPRTFVQSIDQGLKRELESKIQSIHGRKNDLEIRMGTLHQNKTARDRRTDLLSRQRDELESEKHQLQGEYARWEKAKVNLELKKTALQTELDRPSAASETRELNKKARSVNDKSQKIVRELKEMMQAQLETQTSIDVAHLQLLQQQARLSDLLQLKDAQEETFNEAHQKLNELREAERKSRQSGTEALKRAQTLLNEADMEIKELFREIRSELAEQTVEVIQEKRNEEQAKLNMAISVQPGVLDEYRARQKELDQIKSRLRTLHEDKKRVDHLVDGLKVKWKPALEELIANVNSKFSRAFRAIGNAGEVQLAEHEDFNKWGIEILVKFRDAERLQQLNAQRQSGGERSISTITYLLSLTEMSRSPFSLVDEINQGMDQKYERQVHDHMVRVTCTKNAGQYFLITPKLLPDLTYHKLMRVLVINNGEWLPERFDFWRYIQAKKDNKDTSRHTLNTTPAVMSAS